MYVFSEVNVLLHQPTDNYNASLQYLFCKNLKLLKSQLDSIYSTVGTKAVY